MFESVLDELVQRVSQLRGGELEAARSNYFRVAGEPFLDEPSYESRLQNFVEWYIFDRPMADGLTPYEGFMADPQIAAADKQAFLPFRDQLHRLFQILRLVDGGMSVKDLWTEKTYRVDMDVTAGYETKGVAELRLVPWEGGFRLTHTNVYHMKTCGRYIRKRAKALRKAKLVEAWIPFVFQAGALQLKAQRYRHVDAKTIYLELLESAAA